MVTVAHLVEKILEKKPFIQEALARGILNNAALAEELKPEIEKELGKKVKFSAVNMAVRRLGEKLKESSVQKVKFEKDTDMTIKSNLVEIIFYKMGDVQKYIKEIYSLVDYKKGDFLTVTQGLHEVMIITNEKYEKKIEKLFSKNLIKKKIRNLSSLTINIPETSIDMVGLFYIVTKSLTWENINIIDIVSTFTEMTFILNEEDVPRAFKVLKKLIDENK